MITQYSEKYSYPPSDFVECVANKVGIGDSYIIMRTGEYEYTALVKSAVGKTVDTYRAYRTSNNSTYYISHSVGKNFDYFVGNEYYVYSNVGLGRSVDIPVYDQMMSIACVWVCLVVSFLCVFKAVFVCRKKR